MAQIGCSQPSTGQALAAVVAAVVVGRTCRGSQPHCSSGEARGGGEVAGMLPIGMDARQLVLDRSSVVVLGTKAASAVPRRCLWQDSPQEVTQSVMTLRRRMMAMQHAGRHKRRRRKASRCSTRASDDTRTLRFRSDTRPLEDQSIE